MLSRLAFNKPPRTIRMAAAGAPAAAAVAAANPPVPVALDREAFNRTVTLPALRVPKNLCSEMMKRFRG